MELLEEQRQLFLLLTRNSVHLPAIGKGTYDLLEK